VRKLSVLVIHNQYQQPGGEDAVVRAEIEMLQRAGHRVVPFVRSNTAIAEYNLTQKAALFVNTTWNRSTHAHLRKLIAKERPDVVHCHNLMPLMSPSVYEACKSADVPVVQTLHNYRLLCPAATLYRSGQACDNCLRGLCSAVMRGCYRNSHLQTAAVAVMLGTHRRLGTWECSVDAYVALSQFAHDRFLAGGLPAGKVHVKPNFLSDNPMPRESPGDYGLFVGRLSPEKGVLEMLQVWLQLAHIPLVVVGGGPLFEQAARLVCRSGCTHIKLLGQLNGSDTRAQMQHARFLVFPSRWYEPFGMALIEAAACGVPALAANIGGVPELVGDGQTGLLFDPDNPDELAEKANWAWAHPVEMSAMGSAARQRYRERYTPEKNYELLMNIYQAALSN